MNRDIIEGKWNQLSGSAKQKWGKLSDDDIKEIDGRTEKLIGKIQERYGIARDEAERQVDDFSKSTKQTH